MANRLPSLRPREVIRALEKAGFRLHHVTGSHYYFRRPQQPGPLVVVPFPSKELKRGTLLAIVEQTGLTTEEFGSLL